VKVLLSMIRPNPFRNIDQYPLDPAKIDALRESIRSTGFWGNVVARRVGNGHGGMAYELAYGHHRWQALNLEAGGEDPDVDLVLRDLTDEDMLQIMARENMQEWGTSATVEIETVRAVVTAYADGKIQLNPPDQFTSKNLLRHAPSFTVNKGRDAAPDPSADLSYPYTSSTIAPFLGWSSDKVMETLGHLEMIELGILDDAAYRGLSTWQAQAMTSRARELRDSSAAQAARTEQEAAQARAAADEAAAEADRLRQAAEAERERQAAAREAADEQVAQQAVVAEERARSAWEAAQEQRRLAEERAAAKTREADQARQEGAQRAGEGARQAGEQMRGGASVREVLRPPKTVFKTPSESAPQQHPMETRAAEAAGLLQRMLRESDIAEFLTQVAANHSVVKEESRALLAGALTALIDDAMAWRGKIEPFVSADPVPAG
jgi:ParB-like nuclease domain